MQSINRRQFLILSLCLPSCINQTATNGTSLPTTSLLDGYSDKQSYFPGEEIALFLNAKENGVLRLRLLDSLGQEVFSEIIGAAPQKCANAQPWQDGYGYSVTAKIRIPYVKSGIYFWEGIIRCIIKSDLAIPPKILIVYPTNTENAYNGIGGKSFYTPNPGYANTLSFLRPSNNNNFKKFNGGFYKWLLSQPHYDCGHIADSDLATISTFDSVRLLILTGHSEYWTLTARLNFDQFVDRGGHCLILSGNTMWWQTRYSADTSQMICYKYTVDPVADADPNTNLWTNSSYRTISSIGADFYFGGYGNSPNGWNGMKIVAAQSPIFAGTSVANGDIISFSTFEHDGAPISGYETDGTPIINNAKLNFFRVNLIGYDFGTSITGSKSVATWFAFQKTATSGFVINGSSTGWCSEATFESADGWKIKKIIANSIDLLLNNIYPA